MKLNQNIVKLLANYVLDNNEIQEIRLINKVDGDLSPESLFPKNANRLRGFDWRGEERPNSVEDLFKDDPPVKLPVIKGLDDYVPPEDFFDEDVRARVKAAEPEDKTKENKAARNIPDPSTSSGQEKTKAPNKKLIQEVKSDNKKKASGN